MCDYNSVVLYISYLTPICQMVQDITVNLMVNALLFLECPHHCSLCWNETECYECTQGYFLDPLGICERKCVHLHKQSLTMYF